jgi:hypothetical protein
MVTHDNSLANRTKRKLIISDGELINEAISQTFPDLDHHSLLELNHIAREHSYSSGQALSDLTGEPTTLLIASGSLRTKSHDDPDGILYTGSFISGVFSSNHPLQAGPEELLQVIIFPQEQFQRLTGLTTNQQRADVVPQPSKTRWYEFWKRGK